MNIDFYRFQLSSERRFMHYNSENSNSVIKQSIILVLKSYFKTHFLIRQFNIVWYYSANLWSIFKRLFRYLELGHLKFDNFTILSFTLQSFQASFKRLAPHNQSVFELKCIFDNLEWNWKITLKVKKIWWTSRIQHIILSFQICKSNKINCQYCIKGNFLC